MAKIIFTRKAVRDLTQIWNYTFENWSEQQADHYYQLLLQSCKEIAANPELGKYYGKIAPKLFGCRCNRHIIFYRKISASEIEITRILHEKMDLKKHMRDTR